eukprot:10776346-Alexandrium_andersonii.AAC.1
MAPPVAPPPSPHVSTSAMPDASGREGGGEARCTSDGRQFRMDQQGFVWAMSFHKPIGRLTGPFSRGSARGPAAQNWSMKCLMHQQCGLLKSGRQLELREEKLILWILDPLSSELGITTAEQHKARWDSFYT